jgi:integrase
MDIIFEQYRDRLQRKQKQGDISPHTITGFTSTARRLSAWLDDQGVEAANATEPLLEEYFDSLPLAASSRGTHLRHIQAAYVYAVKAGRIRVNPALDLKSPDLGVAEKRIIPAHCLRQIKARILTERDHIWFHLLAYTGMRRAEAIALKWDDGDDSASVLRLGEATIRVIGKGRKPRLVPVHPILGEILKESQRPAGRFVVPSDGKNGIASQTVYDMMRRLSDTYTPHDFRRTVSSSLGRNGVDDRYIDRIMGWFRSDVRERYYMNVAGPELQRAILRLYADDPV